MKNKSVNLEFSLNPNNFRLLENDDYCSIAEVDFLHLGINRNQCNITKESVEKSIQTFYNKPMLCILDSAIDPLLATDFKEHARSLSEESKFVAFGTIPESSKFRFVERDNGKTYLNAKVVIWKNYFPVVMSILQRRPDVKVSIELLVLDGEQDEDTGILTINEFELLSCVLLGEDIEEGIEGSHLEMVKFSYDKKDIDLANKHYKTFSAKYKGYEIPDKVQNAAQDGLLCCDVETKYRIPDEVAMAKVLANETYIDKKEVDRISKKLSNSKKMQDYSTFNLLGGEVVENWLNELYAEKEGESRLKTLSNSELQEKLWDALSKYKYRDGDWMGQKYYINEIYADEKVAIVRDNETAKMYKVPYTVEDDEVKVDLDNKKEVRRTYEEVSETFSINKFTVFAKEDYGKGEKIEVDKSKDAMSDTAWGSINKTELRKKVLDAKNYKTLVKDVYAEVEDGWEDAPSSKLKYPIMEIKDGKAVYNRYGLASALAYAKANDEEAVVSKIEKLYKKLDIDSEDGGEKKEMETEKIENKLDKDNKDIEDIKDDAEAQEDDVKEEIKNADTVDDIGFKAEDDKEVKENKIEKDDKGKEGLEDDVDADKDYWKKKIDNLEAENKSLKDELNKYKREEEERKMAEEIDKFANCMSAEEVEELKCSIKDCDLAEIKEKINSKVAEFATKLKEAEKEDKKIQYSVNPIFDFSASSPSLSKEEVETLDNIINNSHAKIAGE